MISPELINQMIATQKVSAATRIISVADPLATDSRWVAGTELKATVLAALPNGWYRVKISDLLLELNLPRNTQPGEQLELTFVKNQPHLTFLYNPPTVAAATSRTDVDLSAGAKLLAQLLAASTAADSSDTTITSAVTAQRFIPLLQQSQSTAEFAQTLQTTIENTGLFYESHQTQWLLGQRSLAQLRQEPQAQQFQQLLQQHLGDVVTEPLLEKNTGKLPTPSSTLANTILAAALPSATKDNLPVAPSLPPEKENLRALFQALRHAVPQDNSTSPGEANNFELASHAEAAFETVVLSQQKNTNAVISETVWRQVQQEFLQQPNMQHLVQQQLQLLSDGKLVWQGLLWGNQWLEWEIDPDQHATEEQKQEGKPMERYWQTTLKLSLPQLGALEATLHLSANGRVQLQLKTAQDSSAARLRQAQQALNSQFAAAGLELAYSQIDATLLETPKQP